MTTAMPPETILYRFEPYDRIKNYIEKRKITIPNYRCFDDPWEGFVFNCYFQISETDSQSFLGGNRLFMMCFTDESTKESDALWRIYSNKTGVRFKTTVKKVCSVLSGRPEEYFLDSVIYDNSFLCENFFIKNGIIISSPLDKNIIKCLFYKRICFSHEREIRLVAWAKDNVIDSKFIEIDVDPNLFFEEIVFDPRLSDNEASEKSEGLRNLGYTRTYKSPLYRYRRVTYKCY